MYSKAILIALLFLFPLTMWGGVVVPDTIIIDNTYLLIQREVVVDSTKNTEPEPKKNKEMLWRGGLVTTIGLTGSSLTSNNFQSIQEASNDPVLNGINYGVGLRLEGKLSDQVFAFTEIGWDQATWSNRIFNTTQLEDSLFFFESFEQGELSQIIRNGFEIGGIQVIETDTTALTLSDQKTEISSLVIPFGLRYQQPWYNRKSKWTFDVGFAVAYNLNLSEVSPTQIWINEDRPPRVLETNAYSLKSSWITGRLEFGAVHRVSKKLQFTYRYLAETPIQVMDVPEGLEGPEWRIWSNRLKIGINILF